MPGPSTLVLAPEYAPFTGRSPRALAVAELCRALAQEHWRVTVILAAGSSLSQDSQGLARRLEPLRHPALGSRELTVFEGEREAGAVRVIAVGGADDIEPGTLLRLARSARPEHVDIVLSFQDQRGMIQAFEDHEPPRPASLVCLWEPQRIENAAELRHADRIIVPSPHLARLLRASTEGPAAELAERFVGILPGADSRWNPSRDSYLTHRLDPVTVTNKEQSRARLRKDLGLPDIDVPLVAMIGEVKKLSRLAAEQLSKLPVQLVAVDAGRDLSALASRCPSRVAFATGEARAHEAAAAADFFVVTDPGPTPLSGLVACRYGAAPIAEKAGEANDRLVDFDPESQSGCAILYAEPKDLPQAIHRCIRLWRQGPETRQTLVDRCAALDLSWHSTALQLSELAEQLQ